MSIPVDVTDLAETLEAFGAGYLLTVSGEGRVKAVTVEPTVTGAEVVVPAPGRGTLANLSGNDRVTVLLPPTEPKGYTLLVDGVASTDGEDVRVRPSSAVLHRPAAHADGPPPPLDVPQGGSDCGHDCRPVDTA